MAKRRTVQRDNRVEKEEGAYLTSRTSKRANKQTDNVFNFNNYVQECRQRSKVELSPKTEKQAEYVDLLLNEDKLIIFATGPAGTGKTMLAVQAAIKAFKEGAVDKIVITRPAVGVDDEKHGFLPGTLNEKMEPWTKPIFDVFGMYYKPKEIALMLEDQVIEISPLAYMRGRTFKKSYIICDEMQNTSINQMKMMLTRIGDDSKMVLTGDLNQNDKKFSSENGLRDFLDLLKRNYSTSIAMVDFSNEDIMRHEVVKEVLTIYGEL